MSDGRVLKNERGDLVLIDYLEMASAPTLGLGVVSGSIFCGTKLNPDEATELRDALDVFIARTIKRG